MNFPATVQAIRLVKRLYPEALYILIEDKANGSAIIQTLRSEFTGVISITPKGGKVSRVNSMSPAIESGNVFYKACTKFGGAELACMVVGAKVPCILTSRGDSAKTKLYSIALAAINAK